MAQRRRRSLKLAASLAAILAASALLNFIIGWGCMIAAPPILGSTTPAPELGAIVDHSHPVPPGCVVRLRRIPVSPWNGMTEAYGSDCLVGHDGAEGTIAAMRSFQIWTAGWPCQSLAAAEASGGVGIPLSNAGGLRGGFRIQGLTNSVPGAPPRPLPCLPLWGGFIINSVFYAVVIIPVVLVARYVHDRRFLGCCQACGYDLRGLPGNSVCPECGEVGTSGIAPASVS